MMKNELDTIRQQTKNPSTVMRFLRTFGLSLVWGFIAALVIGCLVAGIWTVIPTELLEWGSSRVNLIGYVSHCPFTPISSLILLGSSLIGIALSLKMKARNPIGYTVFAVTGIATLVGMRRGFDIMMFAGMGAGVGIGVVLGIAAGMLLEAER